jgi:hypothetical protein
MKREAIRTEVSSALRDMGFKAKQFRWTGCECHIIVAGEFISIRFPAGMTKREVARQLGRVEGWLEILARLGYGRDETPPSEINASARADLAARSNGRGAHQ